MSSHRHAADAREEIRRLRFTLQIMCEHSMLGIAPTDEELHDAFLAAGVTEYHVCRTMVAIEYAENFGNDRDPDRASKRREAREAMQLFRKDAR